MASWTAVNHPTQPQDEDKQFTIADDEAYKIHLSTGVYMMNAHCGSWSGKLPRDQQSSDTEIQDFIAMDNLRRRLQKANAQSRAAEQQTAEVQQAANILVPTTDSAACSDGEEDHTCRELRTQEKDEDLRSLITLVKAALQQGSVLTLQHTGAHDVDEDMDCMHPDCTCADGYIVAHSYYLTIALPDNSTNICRCCLTCFEAMWNGQVGQLQEPQLDTDMEGQQEAPTTSMQRAAGQMYYGTGSDTSNVPASRKDSVQLQTEIPASLLSSKHAPRADDIVTNETCQSPQRPPQPGAVPSQSSSTMSTGFSGQPSSSTNNFKSIGYAPTSFQYMARLIQPGNGLNEIEKAVLAIWKAATKQQFEWRTTGSFVATLREEHIVPGCGDGMNLVMLQEIIGLSQMQCFGKNLSEALALVAARPD